MKHIINGREVDLETAVDGSVISDALRWALDIPDDRPLILQSPDGTNQVVNPGEKMQLKPGQRFMDAPAHKRGL